MNATPITLKHKNGESVTLERLFNGNVDIRGIDIRRESFHDTSGVALIQLVNAYKAWGFVESSEATVQS